MARGLGFAVTHRYQAWSASLPAENAGDLDARQCRALALSFDEGAGTIGWLGFHAAGAWAQAGETERALSAVERLVAGGWPGQAQWLEEHWALAPLRGEVRFAEAVARQRGE